LATTGAVGAGVTALVHTVGCNRAITSREKVVGGICGSLCCGSPIGHGAMALRPTLRLEAES